MVARPGDGTGRHNASYVRRPRGHKTACVRRGEGYNRSVKTLELQVLKAIIEFCCPWCRCEIKARLGHGPHRCPGCLAEITDLQLHIALASTISSAEA
jgi:ribosomal protein L37AE/L43A